MHVQLLLLITFSTPHITRRTTFSHILKSIQLSYRSCLLTNFKDPLISSLPAQFQHPNVCESHSNGMQIDVTYMYHELLDVNL